MRFRLFKLSERARLLAWGLGTLGWLALDASCSGQAFTASDTPNPSGGGGVGGASGASGAGAEGGSEAGETSSDAGESGSAGAPGGGSAGETSSAGSAGKPSVGCDCVAGEYCQDGTNKCRKCTDFTRLEFGAPQKLLAQGAGSIERFARLTGTGSALFYVSGAPDKSTILYTPSPVSGTGTPVNPMMMMVESGPLFLRGFAEQNLFFDRLQEGHRKLRMALWTPPTLVNDQPIDSLNDPNADDYSIAISPSTKNVYWMSTRNGATELLWQPTSMMPPPAPAMLELKVKAGTAECARSGVDATPWVNLAGTVLLFRNPSLNESCEVNDSGATDLFAVPLNSDGTPKGAATALASLNKTGGMSIETDPSLSADACTMYFASDNGTGDFDLYKAPRK